MELSRQGMEQKRGAGLQAASKKDACSPTGYTALREFLPRGPVRLPSQKSEPIRKHQSCRREAAVALMSALAYADFADGPTTSMFVTAGQVQTARCPSIYVAAKTQL
jgi:hypothetical protein